MTSFLGSFFVWYRCGIEPTIMELSGGQFLPPVRTPVATSIFALAKMQIDSGCQFME